MRTEQEIQERIKLHRRHGDQYNWGAAQALRWVLETQETKEAEGHDV